jgi:hypothetical protein
MATDEGQQATGGFTRRTVLRGGLLAGAGVATAGAMSGILTGTAKAATTPKPQPGWSWCNYCATMWWFAGQNDSACASHYAPLGIHDTPGPSEVYNLYNNIGGLNNKSNPQPGWRWCHDCQGLFWGGNGGVCRGNGYGSHVAGSGTSYDLYFNISGKNTTTNPQAYWRWCKLCSLLYSQGPSGDTAGACPAYDGVVNDNPHVAGSSTNYCIYWGVRGGS